MINWILIIAGVSFFFILFGLVTKRVDEQVDDGKQKSDARKFTQFSTNYISENKRKWMKKK